MNNKTILFLSSVLLIFFFCCNQRYQKKIVKNNGVDLTTDVFIAANKKMIQNEEAEIDSLLLLSKIPFIKHPTGIRISINQNLSNKKLDYAKDGDHVTLLYNCVLFDDMSTIIDDALIDTMSFKIGHSKQMRGLNYGIKLLKIGDKAKIVIPSYLGFGMSGYGKSVPPYSTLLLNVKLLNIEK